MGAHDITNLRSAANKPPELLPIPVKPMDDWASGDPVAPQLDAGHRDPGRDPGSENHYWKSWKGDQSFGHHD